VVGSSDFKRLSCWQVDSGPKIGQTPYEKCLGDSTLTSSELVAAWDVRKKLETNWVQMGGV
jgi:hypothetical protein